MKLCDLRTFAGSGIGWTLSLIMFKRRVLFELEVETTEYSSYSLLFQMGAYSLMYLGLSLGRYGVSFTLLGKNYAN